MAATANVGVGDFSEIDEVWDRCRAFFAVLCDVSARQPPLKIRNIITHSP